MKDRIIENYKEMCQRMRQKKGTEQEMRLSLGDWTTIKAVEEYFLSLTATGQSEGAIRSPTDDEIKEAIEMGFDGVDTVMDLSKTGQPDKGEEVIKKRIEELKQSDAEACEKRWDMSLPELERNAFRELSNELTGRRHELEDLLKIFSSHPTPSGSLTAEELSNVIRKQICIEVDNKNLDGITASKLLKIATSWK